MLIIVKDSILNGSKEVALAAVSCLQTTIVSHSLKGNLPMPYLTSVLEVYEFVFQRSPSYGINSTSKAKQEILHGLGELYVQAQSMFDSQMYTQLLAIIHLAIKQSMMGSENVETDIGNISPIQRTVLEILPLLRPTEQFSSLWLILLRELLHYLPRPEESLRSEEEVKRTNAPDGSQETRDETPNGIASPSLSKAELDSHSSKTKTMCISSNVFPEKVIPLLVDISLQAPTVEKHIILPEIVESLGRCMTSRRDTPDAGLWRTAVEGFNRIVFDDANRLKMNSGPDASISRQARVRFWKEVADVYEVFLVGCCGRALPTDNLPAAAVKADESLEMTVLNILGDNILKSPIDASADILQRLVSTLDRCASRTCTLPIDTVELMPIHSSRFSLTCLEKLFSLTSYDSEACNWNSVTSDISKISVMVLMARCEYILNRFLIDENDLGERPLPKARLEEMIYVLQQLARLVIHKETVCELPLHPHLRRGLRPDDEYNRRAHLLVLFPSFCELVASRESRVRELVQVLLRLIAEELALGKFQALTGLSLQ